MYPNPNIVGWAPHPIVGAVPIVGVPAVGQGQQALQYQQGVSVNQPPPGAAPMCNYMGGDQLQGLAQALMAMLYQGPMGGAAMQMQNARKVDPHAVYVDDTQPTKRRRYPLGFDSREDIGPGLGFPVEAWPQTLFRGERLVVPSAIAEDFVLNDIIVGKDSQKVAPDPLPAEVFTEVGVDVNLNLDTAQPGVIITLNVTNIDTDPHRFRAALIGTSVE